MAEVVTKEMQLGVSVGMLQLAVKAIDALLDLGQLDIVEQVKLDAIAAIPLGYTKEAGFDERALEEAGRQAVIGLVDATKAARQNRPSLRN